MNLRSIEWLVNENNKEKNLKYWLKTSKDVYVDVIYKLAVKVTPRVKKGIQKK
jgi:hypothetical protein